MTHKGIEKFDELVESFAKLPTIGKETAIRLAYHICTRNQLGGMKLARSIEDAVRFIKPCQQYGSSSENELCEICTDDERDKNCLCIVQSPKGILVIEESKSYGDLYSVLDELNDGKLAQLRQIILRLRSKELIFAFTHDLNSSAMIFCIEDRPKDLGLQFNKIAQGIPSGVDLENVDFISLNKAINFYTKI